MLIKFPTEPEELYCAEIELKPIGKRSKCFSDKFFKENGYKVVSVSKGY